MRQKDANIPPSKNFAGFTRAATSVGTAGSVLVTADEPGVKGHVVPSDSYPTRTQEEKQLLSNDISRKRGNSTGSYNGDYGRTGLHDRNYSQYSDLRSPSQEHPTNSTRFNQEPANSTRFTQEHPEESISSNRATHHQIVPDSPKTQQRRMSDHHHDPRVNSNTHPATYFPETTQLDRQAQDQARKVSQDRQHPLEQSAHPATYERNNEYDNNPFNDQSDNHHFNNQSSLNNQSSTTHPATYYPESSTLDKKSQKMADRSSQQNEQSADDQLNESRYYGTQNSGLGSSVDDPPIYDGVRSRQPESSNEKVRVVPQEEAPEVPQRSNAPEVSQRTAPEVPQRTTERTAPEVPERTTQRTSQPELAQRTTQRTSQPELAQRTTQRTSQPELAQRATQPTSQPEVPQRTTQPELAERTTPHTAGNERRSSLMEKIQVGKGVIQKNMGKFLNSNNMQDKGKFSGLSRRE
ncbi:hypothetical protein BDB01DRAFT_801641 [Pilobolus umbonatus]|nr:hypothetical protein BDB01DRAFT_801641 [Pilobolus umbonatus]